MRFAIGKSAVIAALAAFCVFPPNVQAQSEDITLLNDIELLQQRLPAEVFQSIHRAVLLELDELKRIGKLDANQAEQLRVAARGATESALEEWLHEHGDTLRPTQKRNQAKANDAKPAPAAQPQQANVVPMMRLVPAKRIGPPRSVAVKHGIWQDAVAAILREDQKQLLDAAKSSRQKFHQDAEVHRTVAELDSNLRLSEDQRDAFVQILRPTLYNGWLRSRPEVIELNLETEQRLLLKLTAAQKDMWNELKKNPRSGRLLIQVT